MPMDIVVETPRTDPQLEPVKVLLDASALLLATGSVDGVLTGILDIANRIVDADAYAVWNSEDHGVSWSVLAERGLSPAFRRNLQSAPSPPLAALRTTPDIFADPDLKPRWQTYRSEGIVSMLAVPLAATSPRSAHITFYWKRPCTIERMAVPYASALANFASAALTLSELHQQNQREKARLTFLAEASAVLASSLDYETTLNGVARLAASHVADWCTVHMVEDGALTRLIVTHRDPAHLVLAEEYTRRYPEQIREERGLGLLLKDGKTQLTQVSSKMLARAAQDDEHLRLLRLLGIHSILLVPLESRGILLGAIRFFNCHATPPFSPQDIPFAEDLARRAAVAIENARLHRAVSEQENRLRLTHAAARMGSWTWDLARSHILWSPEFRALHGLPSEAVASFEAGSSLMHPEDRDTVLGTLKEALASNTENISYEHRSIRPDGRVLWIHSRGRIERDPHGTATTISGISIDITERHQAEDALRRTEKLAAAGRLAATVAHEVNNPLEALMNLVYLSQQVPGLPDEAAALLATADSELNRMAHIVRQTLGFYRESSHPTLTHLGSIVAEALALYQGKAASRDVTLVPPPTGNHLRAYINGGEIRQVVTNLVSNAIDASPEGAEVHVTLREVGECIEITVSDRGTGISKEHQERLFEPFFTTKADVGTGLGLWVSKGIVENHRGTISVTSATTPPAGTTFTVLLPLELD